MRPFRIVARSILEAYWKAWRSGGASLEVRFTDRVETILRDEYKKPMRRARPDPNAPSAQTSVIDLRRRDQLARAGAELAPLPMKASTATARPAAAASARVAS